MRSSIATIIVLFLIATVANAAPAKKEPFEIAIDNALIFLAKSQNGDGSWASGRGGFGIAGNRDPAISALAVMAFLSAGHVPGEGRYGEVIEKGIRFVASTQQRNGLFGMQQFGQQVMYTHGICTLMIAEAIGLMPNPREAEGLRKQLIGGVQLIRAAQAQTIHNVNSGGWRYSISPGDADISVTGWQMMALRAAKNVGCDVPPENVERAIGYIKRCYDPQVGGYRYTRYNQVTVPCTAASILSLELCGKEYHKSTESLRGAAYIFRENNILNQNRSHFFYGIYYTSQAMFQIGDNYWTVYRQVLHHLLLSRYPPNPAGFWVSTSPDDASAGANYCTAMAVLALTVEYRFLPIYQRGEESDEREEGARK